jgi:hypothetical protein
MEESQAIECVKRFIIAILRVFGTTYLRAPNAKHTVIRLFCIIIIATYMSSFHCYMPSCIIIYAYLVDF